MRRLGPNPEDRVRNPGRGPSSLSFPSPQASRSMAPAPEPRAGQGTWRAPRWVAECLRWGALGALPFCVASGHGSSPSTRSLTRAPCAYCPCSVPGSAPGCRGHSVNTTGSGPRVPVTEQTSSSPVKVKGELVSGTHEALKDAEGGKYPGAPGLGLALCGRLPGTPVLPTTPSCQQGVPALPSDTLLCGRKTDITVLVTGQACPAEKEGPPLLCVSF